MPYHFDMSWFPTLTCHYEIGRDFITHPSDDDDNEGTHEDCVVAVHHIVVVISLLVDMIGPLMKVTKHNDRALE